MDIFDYEFNSTSILNEVHTANISSDGAFYTNAIQYQWPAIVFPRPGQWFIAISTSGVNFNESEYAE